MDEARGAELISLPSGMDDFSKYVAGVTSGDIIVGKHVAAAVRRHVSDLERSKTDGFPYVFDPRKAASAIEIFPILFRHTVGAFAGSPFYLSPWQAFIVGSLFGWRCLDGTRRFRRAYVSIGRKNGKSTLAAGIALLLGTLDGEEQAQVFIGATRLDQSRIIFAEAGRMVQRSPYLAKVADVRVNKINFPASNSYLQPLGSDKAFDGLNPHGVIFDELHAWKEQHRAFYDTLTTGSASRTQPLRFTITTAGDMQSRLWIEENEQAIQVVSGAFVDESYFVYVACLDDDAELFDESAWLKSLPNLGVSVSLEYIRELAREAEVSPQARNRFLRYFGNRQTTNIEAAINVEEWDACQVSELSDWRQAEAITCAIDAGGLCDLMAVAYVAKFDIGEDEQGKTAYRYEVKVECYMDAGTERDLNLEPWYSWKFNGDLHVVPSVYGTVREDVTETMYELGARQIGFDPWNMQQMGETFDADGFEAIKIPQNRYNHHAPLTLLLDLVRTRRIAHDGSQPILRWAMGNLVINSDASERWMPDRKNSKDKIDPAVAVLMALKLASIAKPRPKGSVFVS